MPSLLTLDQNRHNPNLQSLYRIGRVPCDTRLREILDEVPPERLRPLYQDLFRRLQRGKVRAQQCRHPSHREVENDQRRNRDRRGDTGQQWGEPGHRRSPLVRK